MEGGAGEMGHDDITTGVSAVTPNSHIAGLLPL